LRDVSLSVEGGKLVYLLGPNGSGKTTLVRLLMGLYKPDKGLLRVLGVEPRRPGWDKVRARIGYLPENADVYERFAGLEILEFYARLYEANRWRVLLDRAIGLTGLGQEDLRRRAGEYSKGMRRRLLLAVALMRDPELLVLDEPFSGVDVITAYNLKRELSRLRRRGVTILATSHNILEAERYADKVVFIYRGAIVFEGSVGEALERYRAESLEEAFTRAVGEA
jgi:ABC-2 type transport system ATP-binding protein